MSPASTSSLPQHLHETITDFQDAGAHMVGWFAKHRMAAMLMVIGSMLTLASLAVWDDEVVSEVACMNAQSDHWQAVARPISYFGDFLGLNLALFAVLRGAALLARSRRLAKIAVASLLCACATGMTANVVRVAAGRPRPSVPAVRQWCGPTLDPDFQALPSAHTATAFGGALPLLYAQPSVGIPVTLGATAVGWSRLQLNRHHLTDVAGSIALALLFSLPMASWLKRDVPARLKRTKTHLYTLDGLAAS